VWQDLTDRLGRPEPILPAPPRPVEVGLL
jgi:hypothetical protein